MSVKQQNLWRCWKWALEHGIHSTGNEEVRARGWLICGYMKRTFFLLLFLPSSCPLCSLLFPLLPPLLFLGMSRKPWSALLAGRTLEQLLHSPAPRRDSFVTVEGACDVLSCWNSSQLNHTPGQKKRGDCLEVTQSVVQLVPDAENLRCMIWMSTLHNQAALFFLCVALAQWRESHLVISTSRSWKTMVQGPLSSQQPHNSKRKVLS